MATAQPLSMEAHRKKKQKQAFINSLQCKDRRTREACEPERLQIGERALDAPILERSLDQFSYAWQCAMVMLDCYATIPRGDEPQLLRTFNAETLEEAAEGMMIDGGYEERRSRRVFELAAKVALHALIWAREQPR